MKSEYFKQNFKNMLLKALFLTIGFYIVYEYFFSFIKTHTVISLILIFLLIYKLDFKMFSNRVDKADILTLFEILLGSFFFFLLIDFNFKFYFLLANLIALYFTYNKIVEKGKKLHKKNEVEIKRVYEVKKVENIKNLSNIYENKEIFKLPIILNEELPKSTLLYENSAILKNLSLFISELNTSYIFGINSKNDNESALFQSFLKDEQKRVFINFNPFLYSGQSAMFEAIMSEFLKEIGYFDENPFDVNLINTLTNEAFKNENMLEETFSKIVSKDGLKQRLHEFLQKNQNRYVLVFNDIDALDVKEILSVFKISKMINELKNGVLIFIYDKEKIYRTFKNEKTNLGIFYKFIAQEIDLPKINYANFYKKILKNICNIYEKNYKKDEIIAQKDAIFDVEKLVKLLVLLNVDIKNFTKLINLVFGNYIYEIMKNVDYSKIKYCINLNDFAMICFIKFSNYNLYNFLYENKNLLYKSSSIKKIGKNRPAILEVLNLLNFPFNERFFSVNLNNSSSFMRYFDTQNLVLYKDITFTLWEGENLKVLFNKNHKNPNFESNLVEISFATKRNIFLFDEIFNNYEIYKSINFTQNLDKRAIKIEAANFLAQFLSKFSQADKREIFKKYDKQFYSGSDLEFKKYFVFYALYSVGFRISKKEELEFYQLLQNINMQDYRYLSNVAWESNFLKGVVNKKLIYEHLKIIAKNHKEFNVNYDAQFLDFFSKTLNAINYSEFKKFSKTIPLNSLNLTKASLVNLSKERQNFMQKTLNGLKKEIIYKNINLYKDDNYAYKNIYFLDFKSEEEKNYLHNLIKNLNKEQIIWLLDDIKNDKSLFAQDKVEIQKRSLELAGKDEEFMKFKEKYEEIFVEPILIESKK